MKIIRKSFAEIKFDERANIDRFIENNNGLVFHETEFNRIVSEFFNTELSFFVAYNTKKQIIGVCPFHTIKKGWLKLTYSNPSIFEVPYGGWVFDNKKVNLQQLLKFTKISINESLIYWSNIEIEDNGYKKLKANFTEFQTALIDLNISEDDIFMNYISANKRSKIRRAIKKGVKIKIGGIEYFDDFFSTFCAMKERTGLNKRSKEYYFKMVTHYCPKSKCCILLSEYENKIISGLMIVGNKNVFHYWFGGMFQVEKNLYQNDYLHWEAIKWAKKNGCKYYDLCVVEQERLPNIAKFKLGFSKNIVPFYYFVKKPLTYKVLSEVQKIINPNINKKL